MSSSGRDSDSWDQGHGMAAGDPSQSPAGERVGQSRTGFLEEEKQKEWGGQCFIRLFIGHWLTFCEHLLNDWVSRWMDEQRSK